MDPGAFSAADFEALEAYEVRKRAGPVSVALEDVVPGLRGYDRCVCVSFRFFFWGGGGF